MKLKKILSLLLGCSMLMSFSGCGGGSTGSTATSDTTAQTSQESETSAQNTSNAVTLKAYFIGAPPADQSKVQDAINEYTAEKLGVKLDIVFTDFGDFDKKAQVVVNSGEDYDLIFTCAWANDYLSNARKGAFLELDPYLDKPEFTDLKNAIDQGFWDGAKVDGKIYAVPTQKEIAQIPMYMFNKELIQKYNFDINTVKNIKDIEPLLQQVKDNESGITPFMDFADRAYRGPYDYILGYDYPLAVQIEGDNKGKVVNMYDLQDMKEYITTMRDYFTKGYINPDAATKEGTMTKGEVFAVSFGDGQPYAEVTWSNDSGFDISATQMTTPIVTTSSTRGSMMAVNKNSKSPDKAVEFLQALNTDSKLHNLVNYGIEGVHYDLTDKGQLKRTDAGQNNYLVPTFALGNLFNTYTVEGEPLDKWDEFKKQNSEALRSPLLGLDINTDSIKTELANISNLRKQYEPLLQTGSTDTESTLAEFNKKLDEAGFQKVTEEVQKQVDAFLNK